MHSINESECTVQKQADTCTHTPHACAHAYTVFTAMYGKSYQNVKYFRNPNDSPKSERNSYREIAGWWYTVLLNEYWGNLVLLVIYPLVESCNAKDQSKVQVRNSNWHYTIFKRLNRPTYIPMVPSIAKLEQHMTKNSKSWAKISHSTISPKVVSGRSHSVPYASWWPGLCFNAMHFTKVDQKCLKIFETYYVWFDN